MEGNPIFFAQLCPPSYLVFSVMVKVSNSLHDPAVRGVERTV